MKIKIPTLDDTLFGRGNIVTESLEQIIDFFISKSEKKRRSKISSNPSSITPSASYAVSSSYSSNAVYGN